MTTEREKMTAGEPYQQFDKELIDRRVYIRQQIEEINHITNNNNRNDRFKALLADTGDDFFVESDFKFDYGFNIHIGDHFYGNYDMTFLDTCPITIGSHCYFDPNIGCIRQCTRLTQRSGMLTLSLENRSPSEIVPGLAVG